MTKKARYILIRMEDEERADQFIRDIKNNPRGEHTLVFEDLKAEIVAHSSAPMSLVD